MADNHYAFSRSWGGGCDSSKNTPKQMCCLRSRAFKNEGVSFAAQVLNTTQEGYQLQKRARPKVCLAVHLCSCYGLAKN